MIEGKSMSSSCRSSRTLLMSAGTCRYCHFATLKIGSKEHLKSMLPNSAKSEFQTMSPRLPLRLLLLIHCPCSCFYFGCCCATVRHLMLFANGPFPTSDLSYERRAHLTTIAPTFETFSIPSPSSPFISFPPSHHRLNVDPHLACFSADGEIFNDAPPGNAWVK